MSAGIFNPSNLTSLSPQVSDSAGFVGFDDILNDTPIPYPLELIVPQYG